ncbi:MAG TPA: hypothetical protein VK864_06990, partial [Longimicrobiales bacterium]|nr:hypothetical protein [Longimicrobiales bacterium]
MPLRASILLLVLTATATRAIGAQAADFAILNDSLSRIHDSIAVRRLEESRLPARNAPAPAHVTHGLIALRLYELTGDEAVNRRATEAFERAIQRDQALSWAHFGLARSLATSAAAKPLSSGGKRGFFVLDDVARRLVGRDARSRARAAYKRALTRDPPAEPAARELAELVLAAPETESLQEARTALQNLGTTSALDLAALTRVHTALGDTVAANHAAAAALAASATTATRYAAARAWLLGSRAEAGARLLFDAIRTATGEELRVFYDDVVPIAAEVEKEQWQTGDTEARRRLLLEFWDLRAGLAGVTVAQRLTEHFERLRYAEQHFLRMHEFPPPDPAALRIVSNARLSRFDDRGDFYIRHGRPEQEILTRKQDGADFLSWAYRQPDRSTRLIHFFRDGPDFRLAGRIPCDQEFLRDRAGLDARLGPASVRCDQLRMLSYSAEYRELASAALATDSHHARF